VAPGSNGLGSLVTGSLEMSNVDLAGQLTQLITTQRAYEANAKVITTSDEILQDLVNLGH
jgi:flagellar hook protein FlgE